MILAATEPWVDFLVNSGPIGVILVMAALGWVHFKPAMDQCLKVNNELRADLRQALEDLRKQEQITREIIVPAVTQSSLLVQRLTEQIWKGRAA